MTQSTSDNLTVEDIVEYFESRTNNTRLKDWSRNDFAAAIQASIADGSFRYCVRNGKLAGACVGRLVGGNRYHVVAIQTDSEEILIEFIFTYLVQFAPHYPVLTGEIRGRLKQFNPLRYLRAIKAVKR